MKLPLNLLHMSDLKRHRTENPPEFLVDKLIAAGTFNLLIAKPKVGKSTLARQLVACVLRGSEFLGRKVKQGEVIYLSCEEKKNVICAAMERHGITGEDNFYASTDNPGTPDMFVDALTAALKQLQNVKLVVLDTLGDYLQGVNLDDYSTVNPLVKKFVALADEFNVCILAVYHSRKRAGSSAGDTVLGSTAITGAADTAIYLSGEALGTRTFKTISREGDMVPATKLYFDEVTRSFSVGELVKSQREKNTLSVTETRRNNVLDCISGKAGIGQQEILKTVGGNAKAVSNVIDELVEKGLIKRRGRGRSGSPYTFEAVPEEGNWAA
jgi:predicted transcriptional regulator